VLAPSPAEGLRWAPNGWIIWTMAAAAICGTTRANAWDDELAAIAAELPQLPPGARVAVRDVLNALLAEGAFESRQARQAERVRDELDALPAVAHAA
jgi:hypothetical protein